MQSRIYHVWFGMQLRISAHSPMQCNASCVGGYPQPHPITSPDRPGLPDFSAILKNTGRPGHEAILCMILNFDVDCTCVQ